MRTRPPRCSRGLVLGLALAAAACATTGQNPAATTATGPTVGELTSAQKARAASFYTPTRGPLDLDRAADLAPPPAPVRAAIYVPECASPDVPEDHIAYLQSLGMAVAVPFLEGEQCVVPSNRLGTIHDEIDRVAAELKALPWISADGLYLVGHGVGADVASTYTRDGTFRGLIGLAAACPFGIQNVTPMLTFRALDDPVLRNRGTRCAQFPNATSMHIEFSGSDHALRLSTLASDTDASSARTLMRNTIARFVGAGDPLTTIAERDAADVRQLGGGGAPAAPAPAPGDPAPIAVDTPAFAEPADAAPVAGVAAPGTPPPAQPVADPPRAAETPTPEAAPVTPTASETAAETELERRPDVLYLPPILLPPGRF